MKHVKNLMYAIRPIWKTNKVFIILNFLLVFINIPKRLLNVYIIKYIVDAAAYNQKYSSIFIMGIMFLCLELIIFIIDNLVSKYYNAPVREKIRMNLKKNIYKKATEIDISSYDNNEFYNKYVKALNASDDTSFKVFETILEFLNAVISVLTLTSVVIIQSPILILSAFTGVSISLIFNFVNGKKVYEHKNEKSIIDRRLSYINRVFYLQQYAKDLRTSEIKDVLICDFNNNTDANIRLEKKYSLKYAILNISSDGILSISDMFMWLYIAYQIYIGVLKPGDFMALSNAVWQLTHQIKKVFKIFPKFYEHSLFIDNIKSFEEYKSQLTCTNNRLITLDKFNIRFQDVSFEYNERVRVLKKLSFEIESNKKIGIVGYNGAGKSTLIKLLIRLYDPIKGKILLNGYNYMDYDISKLRSLFAVVYQDYQYYAYSIAENVLMRKVENIEDENLVIRALTEVGLYNKVSNLIDGIYTVMSKEFSDNGVIFSGGELQKLSIARAIVKDTPVIIMDEPSSALDPISESEIINLCFNLFKNKILIIISHRLSMTKDMDEILVLENGEIVERGTHNHLLKLGGRYSKMWEAQCEKYIN